MTCCSLHDRFVHPCAHLPTFSSSVISFTNLLSLSQMSQPPQAFHHIARARVYPLPCPVFLRSGSPVPDVTSVLDIPSPSVPSVTNVPIVPAISSSTVTNVPIIPDIPSLSVPDVTSVSNISSLSVSSVPFTSPASSRPQHTPPDSPASKPARYPSALFLQQSRPEQSRSSSP